MFTYNDRTIPIGFQVKVIKLDMYQCRKCLLAAKQYTSVRIGKITWTCDSQTERKVLMHFEVQGKRSW